jgi:SAM-dependent methyltransferase
MHGGIKMPENLLSCPYCGSIDIQKIWPQSNWDRCVACGLYFRNPVPVQQELDSLYANSWQKPEQARSETGGTDLKLARVYVKLLIRSLGLRRLTGLRLLDFGAGRGDMSKALIETGAEVVCVEPYGVDFLKARGFEAYASISEVKGKFDGIVTIDVFEHLRNPWDTLRELSNLLKVGGWMYVATGNPCGLNATINRGNWREAKKAGHLVFPSPSTMEKILHDAGFAKIKRLRWLIRFHRNPLRAMGNYLIQMTGLDGELMYLCWK